MQRRPPGPAGPLAPAAAASPGVPASPAMLAALAVLALLLGTAVYLLDRPAGSAWLVPPSWQAGSTGRWFGRVGPWLPSLVHAFAFSVLTALALPRRPWRCAAACTGWVAIDSLAELGQHAAVSGPLADALVTAFDGAAGAARVGRYFTMGSFDLADLVAGGAGGLLAYAALRRWLPPPETPADPDAAPLRPSRHPSPHRGSRT